MRTPWPDWLQDWDVQTFLTLHRWMHDAGLHNLMRFCNELGNAFVLLPIYLGLTALETDWRRGVRRAIHLALAMILVAWTTDVLKESIDRSRPFSTCTAEFSAGRATIEWGDARDSRSWPSGHTSTAVTWISVLFCWTGGIAIRWRRRARPHLHGRALPAGRALRRAPGDPGRVADRAARGTARARRTAGEPRPASWTGARHGDLVWRV
jgi:membrane-associated PAP2 superfamily phosphatase